MPITPRTGTGGRRRKDESAPLDAAAVRALVDTAPDGILMVDDEGSIIFANRRAESQFGYAPDGLVGLSIEELIPDRLRQVHRTHRARYRAEPRLRPMGAGLLLFGRRTDGTEFPVEVSLSPLSTGDGLRIVAVVRDVSARVAAEARQREVQEALDATRDAVLMLDAETLRFTYANQGAVEQVGYTRDELLEMTMLDIAPEFSDRELRELVGPLARGEQTSLMFRTTHRHRHGTDIPVEILIQPILGDDGVPTGYVEVVRDIRERIETEDRLRRAEQHVRIVEDRERIARDLHDVVIQKLFAAGMSVQSVAARSDDPHQAERLSHVVDDLDDTIREIRSVIFSLQAAGTDAPGLRADVLRVVDQEQPALGFAPRVRFDGPVDATTPRVTAELLPALREALSNAARHATASSVEIEVERFGDLVTLRVLDDGRGLPEFISRGNGLANMSERAEKLGGVCRATTRAGGGTELEWRVPDPTS
jgi:PAS domain S-box-containing protein